MAQGTTFDCAVLWDPGPLSGEILSESEVRVLSREVRRVLSPILGEVSSYYGGEIEDSVRFGAVATRVRDAREARGLDLKAAAKTLRVPQSRLRDIEKCRMKSIRPTDLHAYIEFLEVNKWFAGWSKANPKLARRLDRNMKSKRK